MNLRISDFTSALGDTPFAQGTRCALTVAIEAHVRAALAPLDARDWQVQGEVAVHRSASVEPGAQLKGPIVVGELTPAS
jgi:UDP-N-acetylglucosamine diphosphorylase / glucose-1-phosphate thymidylyltransferase / UDP-N-acetylgalactosamine diphosphorylase / glucosamine-1-phosphate N-acetyltransferase / galactosamine-1-phosphate N-acetyltransferase